MEIWRCFFDTNTQQADLSMWFLMICSKEPPTKTTTNLSVVRKRTQKISSSVFSGPFSQLSLELRVGWGHKQRRCRMARLRSCTFDFSACISPRGSVSDGRRRVCILRFTPLAEHLSYLHLPISCFMISMIVLLTTVVRGKRRAATQDRRLFSIFYFPQIRRVRDPMRRWVVLWLVVHARARMEIVRKVIKCATYGKQYSNAVTFCLVCTTAQDSSSTTSVSACESAVQILSCIGMPTNANYHRETHTPQGSVVVNIKIYVLSRATISAGI